MTIKKIKGSELPEVASPTGIYAIGVKNKRTVRTSLDNLATKDDLKQVATNSSVGTLILGERANIAAIKLITDSKTGHTYKAIDTGDYWTYKGENDVPYNPSLWENIGKILPSDFLTKEDLTDVEINTGHPFIISAKGNTEKINIDILRKCLLDVDFSSLPYNESLYYSFAIITINSDNIILDLYSNTKPDDHGNWNWVNAFQWQPGYGKKILKGHNGGYIYGDFSELFSAYSAQEFNGMFFSDYGLAPSCFLGWGNMMINNKVSSIESLIPEITPSIFISTAKGNSNLPIELLSKNIYNADFSNLENINSALYYSFAIIRKNGSLVTLDLYSNNIPNNHGSWNYIASFDWDNTKGGVQSIQGNVGGLITADLTDLFNFLPDGQVANMFYNEYGLKFENFLQKTVDSVDTSARIPSVIYAVSNYHKNIYIDSLVPFINNGLEGLKGLSGIGYPFETDGYRFLLPPNIQQGIYSNIAINLVNEKGQNLLKATTSLNVIGKYYSKSKNVVICGDSIMEGMTVTYLREIFINVCGNSPNFVGTVGSTAGQKWEGNGGWASSSYVTNYVNSDTGKRNPFWNPSTNKIDIAYYKSKIGVTVIDGFSYMVGANDSWGDPMKEDKLHSIIDNIKKLFNALLADNSKMRIVIQLNTLDFNTQGDWLGQSAKYGMEYNLFQIRKGILDTFDNSKFHSNVFVGDIGFGLDRYRGFAFKDISLPDLYGGSVKVHTNNVHPSSTGYKQLAEAIFPSVKKLVDFDDPIEVFKKSIKSKGGDIAEFEEIYDSLDTTTKSAETIMIPSIADEGLLYGMNSKTGDLVNFNYSRNSIASTFDKEMNVVLSENNMPRIDYGNYGANPKILIEKERTNLLTWTNNAYLEHIRLGEVVINFTTPQSFGVTNSGTSGSAVLDKPYTSTFWYKILEPENGSPSMRIINNRPEGGTVTYRNMTLKDRQYHKDVFTFPAIGTSYVGHQLYNIFSTSDFQKKVYLKCNQIEEGEESTSYIPTENAPVTRKADNLSIKIEKQTTVFVKTTKQTIVVDRAVGMWNIHELLNNEGIELLAIFGRVLTNSEKSNLTASYPIVASRMALLDSIAEDDNVEELDKLYGEK